MSHPNTLKNDPILQRRDKSCLPVKCRNLIKNYEQVFLAIIRTSNDFVPLGKKKKGENQRSPSYGAVNSAHGMTEGQKRKINKESGPKKNIISVKERER